LARDHISCGKTPLEVQGISDATQVASSPSLACALLSSGDIDCWGDDYDGELGNAESLTTSDIPVEVQGISNATEVTVGGVHTCALLSTGHVDCWGENGYGELGDGMTGVQSHIPVEVQGISDATQVVAGSEHTCALLSSGHIDCWGNNERGGLGDGSTTDSNTPTEVQGIDNAVQVAAGWRDTCALLSTGHVDCWGADEDGQLGNAARQESSATPVEVQGISSAKQVTVGNQDACALLSSDQIDCWGENSVGQLGDGKTAESDLPVEVV